MRTLAVTGDDFGASRGVNRGIAEAHDRGVLTRASLMVAGEDADEAVAMARARPGLSVGLHLVVVDGRAALPPSEIPSLAGPDGRFRGGPVRAGLRYQFSGAARRELEREIRAQLERFAETGLPLSHVDGHHHMHLHPVVLDTLVRAAASLRLPIPEVRLPSEELGLAVALDSSRAASTILWNAVFRLLRRHGQRRLASGGIGFAERVYGLHATGRITETYLLALIPRVRAEAVELYAHPAAPLAGEPFQGPASGPEELAALTSGRVRAAIQRAGFVLKRPPSAETAPPARRRA